MPNEGKDKSTTPPNGPPKGASDPPTGSQRTLDLNAYRTAPTEDPKDAAQSEANAQRNPKVHWADLAGIEGLRIVDFWRGATEEFGEYAGSVIQLPARGKAPATDVTALANLKTQAGIALGAAEMRGAFDHLGEPNVPGVQVRVRLRKTTGVGDDGKPKKPMVLLTIGGA